MRFECFSFGSLRIDGVTHEHDLVIDGGEISRRKKKPSKKFREEFEHTPLSVNEKIPWKCRRLVIGTGAYGRLSVMRDVEIEAKRRQVELVILPTARAIKVLERDPDETNAILHIPVKRTGSAASIGSLLGTGLIQASSAESLEHRPRWT